MITNHRTHSLLLTVLLAGAWGAGVPVVRAADNLFTNLAGDRLWSTGANWSAGRQPDATDFVKLTDTTASYAVTNDVAAVIDKLLVSTTSGKTTTLVVDDTITVKSTASGAWSCDQYSHLIVKAGGSFVATNGTGYFNAPIYTTSSALIENGGTFIWKNYALSMWYVAMTNRGVMKTVAPRPYTYGIEMTSGGASLVLDGGQLLDPGYVLVGDITITNNGALLNRELILGNMAIRGLWIGGFAAANGKNQTNTFTLAGGTVTNNLSLRIGDQGSGEGYNWWTYPVTKRLEIEATTKRHSLSPFRAFCAFRGKTITRLLVTHRLQAETRWAFSTSTPGRSSRIQEARMTRFPSASEPAASAS